MIALDLGPKIMSARVICADNRGPKVLLCEDGEIIKYFRAGRSLSHLGFLKRAEKFKRNASVIRDLGFRTPGDIRVVDGIAGASTVVRYQSVLGVDLKTLLERGESSSELCIRLGRLMRVFHDQGIVFKANHLANFIHLPGEPLGVIDFDNLYKMPFALPTRFRIDNLRRLVRHDRCLVEVNDLLAGYCGEQLNSRVEAVVEGVVAEYKPRKFFTLR